MSQAGSDDSRSGGSGRKARVTDIQDAGAAPAAGGQDEMVLDAGSGMPTWVDAAFPWAVSVLLHIGIFLLVLFASYMANQSMKDDADRELIIIPTAISDPTEQDGSNRPGSGGDPTRDAAQDKIQDVMRTDGWAQTESNQNVAGFLSGNESDTVAMGITRGAGASIGGKGQGGTGTGDGGVLAPYGTPGGGTGGPRTGFYGTAGNASRVVYILDHSGSMLDNFNFLQLEVRKSVEAMLPVHYFAVIVVSENAEVLGQMRLERATADNKRDVTLKMDRVVAQGQNDEMLIPFKTAFEKAFAMKPQLVYFLTDGKFDAKLMDVVKELNKDRKVRINTIAFVNDKQRDYFDQLSALAKENGGMFKFVSEKDLGR